MSRKWTGFLFTLPAILLVSVVLLIPLSASILMSLRDSSGLGLHQYAKLIQDEGARHSFLVTFVFTLLSLAGHFALGFIAALLLKTRLYLSKLWRVLLLIPWIISPVICGVIWRWMLDPLYGVIHYWLTDLGLISQPILWLENPFFAVASVTLAWIWTGFPFVMLIILAGLQQIPESLYEAAKVDGASGLQRFGYITLPNLKMVLVVAALLDIIQCFRAFSSIYVMTHGGPGGATNIISIFIFKHAFEYFNFEYASAAGVSMALILLFLGYLYMKLIEEEVV